jgi:anti-anti-sigma factor
MTLISETHGNLTVARPEGRLDGMNSAGFQDALLAIVERGGNVVVDGSALTYVSIAGLRTILVAAKAAQAKGFKLALCALNPGVREIFAVSGFEKIIPIHEGLDQALSDQAS